MVEKKMTASVDHTTEIVKQEPAKVAVVAKKAETVKKAEAPKTEDKKAPETEAAESKKAAPKKPAAKKPAEKKSAAKTAKADTAAVKAPAKKAAPAKTKKEADAAVILQFAGREIAAKEVLARAKADWLAAGHEEADLNEITLYMKPEDFAAYYVVNGIDTGSIDL